MENTNQKNTGNIQIAPVSAAADLNHKREGYLTWDEYFIASISTSAPFGIAATSKAALAGHAPSKKVA